MENKKLPLMDKYPDSFYQPLFDLMREQHGLILLSSEMSDIVEMVKKLDRSQSGTVWVKASEYDSTRGGVLFYRFLGPTLKSCGTGNFSGGIFHGLIGDHFTKDEWEYLYILDEANPNHYQELKERITELEVAGSEASGYIEFLDVQNNRLRKALFELVHLKDRKDKEGDFLGYSRLKQIAWESAREVVKGLGNNGNPKKEGEDE